MALQGAHSVHWIERGLQLCDVGWAVVVLSSRFLGSAPFRGGGSIPLRNLDLQGSGPLQMRDVQLRLALGQEAVYVVHGDDVGLQSSGENPLLLKLLRVVDRLGVVRMMRWEQR